MATTSPTTHERTRRRGRRAGARAAGAARGAADQKEAGAARPAWREYLPRHRVFAVAKTPVLVALGMYLAGGHFAWGTVGVTLALTSLLWALLYALNEACDLAIEDGRAVPPWMPWLLAGGVAAVCAGAGLVSARLLALFGAMAALQIAYCAPPVRLKRWWWPIIVFGGVLNPLLRIACGALWGSVPIPALALAAPVLMHLGATFRTRALQRKRDRSHGYRVAPPGIEAAGTASTVLGILGGAYLCAVGIYPRLFLLFGPPVIAWGVYAWSAKATSMARLRRGWALFAVGAVFALAVLLAGR